MNPLLAVSGTDAAVGAGLLVYVVACLFLLALAVLWVLLPILLLRRLDQILLEMKTLNYSAAVIMEAAERAKRPAGMPDPETLAREING